MGERLGRAGRWLLTPFLSAGRFILSLPKRAARAAWAYLGVLGLALRRILSFLLWRPLVKVGGLLARLLHAFWAYVGLLGLTLRKVLHTLLWRPLSWVARPFVAFFRIKWAYYGLLGIALRRSLTKIVWRPLVFLSRPFRWSGRRMFRPIALFVNASLTAFAGWFVAELLWSLIRRAGKALSSAILFLFHYLKAYLRYGALLARARILVLLRVTEAENVVIYVPAPTPGQVRFHRITTAVVASSLVLLLGFITSQSRKPEPMGSPSALAAEVITVQTAPQEASMVASGGDSESEIAAAGSETTASPRREEPSFDRLAAVRASLNIDDRRASAAESDFVSPAADIQWPVPDPLGKGGSLAFTLRQGGGTDIYVLTLGQDEPLQVTADPADDRDPAWSPDGKQLAFASRRDGNWELYVLSLADGMLKRLTDDPGFDAAPVWSPDGQWLVYESYRDSNLDLYILAADGESAPIRLTEHPAPDFSPAWSPDGRHIAFVSWRSGNKDIFLHSLDAVSDERAMNLTASPDRYEDHPTFEPAGRYLSYHDDSGGLDLVYILPLEQYAPAGRSRVIGQGRHASWSPDGSSLAYVYQREDQSLIIASSVDSWAIAPMAFAHPAPIDDLAWMGYLLPRNLDQLLDLPASVPEQQYTEGVAERTDERPRYLLWKVDVEAPSAYLSDRVDQSFAALRGQVMEEAGWDFLGSVDNLYTPLFERPLPGVPEEDWNKAGRAFDFYSRYPISVNPRVEIVREDRGGQTYWRVYLLAAEQDGSQGEPLRQMPWDFRARYDSDPRYYDQGGKTKEFLPSGYYVDFTALAEAYGWKRTPALENWRTYFQATRYWHYEKREGLTWEEAMHEIYSAPELAALFGD